MEGAHTGFMRKTTGKRARQKVDRTWVNPGAELVLEATGNQSVMADIGRRQGAVDQWVMLRPIFEVCTRNTGNKGGWRRRDVRWRQEMAETQFKATLDEISR